MKGRTTLILLLAVSLIGGFIYFFERETDSTERRREVARQALRMEVDRINWLSIVSDDMQLVCERSGAQWRITSPVPARADESAVLQVIETLAQLPRSEVITAAQMKKKGLTYEQYGLEQPRYRILYGDEKRRVALLVGRDAPLGGNLFLREETSSDVIVTGTNLIGVLPRSVDDLRDRRLFLGYPSEAKALNIKRTDGFVQLVKGRQDQWMLQKPLVSRAGFPAIQSVLEQLYNLRVSEFVAESVAASSLYGLDEPALQITVTSARSPAEQTLLIGKPVASNTNLLYAGMQGIEAVYTVSNQILQALSVRAEDLRDRRLLALVAYDVKYLNLSAGEKSLTMQRTNQADWVITAPRQYAGDGRRIALLLSEWSGTTVARYLDNPGTNLAALGFSPPRMSITFAPAPPAPAAATNEPAPAALVAPEMPATGESAPVVVEVSSRTDADNLVLVRVVGDESLYLITPEPVNLLSVEPLLFRNKRVLALNPDSVRRVAVMQGGVEQAAERDATNVFVAAQTGARLDAEAIAGLLSAVSSLSAVTFVTEAPSSLDTYGLSTPYATVTLGLTGEAGIGKTLHIGAEAGADARYAMIQGQDVIFTLENTTVTDLLPALYRAADASSTTNIEQGATTIGP